MRVNAETQASTTQASAYLADVSKMNVSQMQGIMNVKNVERVKYLVQKNYSCGWVRKNAQLQATANHLLKVKN